MTNIGLLKLELLHKGIRAGKGLPSPLTNPFGLVHLVLPESVAVSVHLTPSDQETPYTLLMEGGRFFLETSADRRIPVHWTPPLKSYQKKTSSGVLVSEILTVHGGFIAVHPRGPCRFGRSGLSCRYCGSSNKDLSDHPPFTKRDLVEAIQIVLEEKKCDFVHLSSGHVETEDGGVAWLGPWVTEIRKHIRILISLDLVPPKTNDWIDQAYAMGVDALYYDLDIFNPKEAGSTQRYEAERRRHLEALEYAASIFPKGAVLSHLVIGLEPLAETKKGIDLLLKRGVVPILVYFPPYPGSDLAARWKVAPSECAPLYACLFENLVKSGNTPHWVQQTDVVLTPLEGRFFSEKSAGLHLALKKFYQTGLGRSVRMGLIGMRRRLRVRHQPAGFKGGSR